MVERIASFQGTIQTLRARQSDQGKAAHPGNILGP
jgi:hypothetical protein